MKRLLAYLIVIINLGLTFNVNVYAASGKGLCINGLTNGVSTPLVTKSKNLGLCSEKEFLLKRKYPTPYRLLKKKVGNFKTSKQISLIEILYIINDTDIFDEYNKSKKKIVAKTIVEKKKKKTQITKVVGTKKEYFWLGKKVSKKEFEKLSKVDQTKSKFTDQFLETGFNIFNTKKDAPKEFTDYHHVEAYFSKNCMKHGLVKYIDKKTGKTGLEVFGIFKNCTAVDPLQKVAKIIYDNGNLAGIDLFKKDVSHLYGNKPKIGAQLRNIKNQNAIKVKAVDYGKPFSKANINNGDILLKINSIQIKSVSQFVQILHETARNNKVSIEYIPGGFVNDKFEFNLDNVKIANITPEFLDQKVGLHIGYNVRLDFYFEGLTFKNSEQMRLVDEVQLAKGTESFNNRQSILKHEFFELKKYYDSIRKIRDAKIIDFDRSKLYIVSNKKVFNTATLSENQKEFIVSKSKDNNPPIITVEKNITVNNANYQISGKVEDDTSKKIYVEVDGIIENTINGNFTIKRFSPVNETISLVAIDKWGNRSKPISINVKIDIKKTILTKKIERLNPSIIKKQSKPNKVALIIGIENYSRTPKASYANLDAKFFYEYAKNNFGIKDENIKLLIDNEANLIDTLSALNKWLPGKVRKGQTELIIYFAGHGLASNDGKELYLLPQDGDSDLLARTGISRTELFDTITKLKPKNVTIFLDTCYSGVSRDEEILLASARPVKIVADKQTTIPDNFTIFSASQLDQISSGLKEAKHGIFSYYLMKGLEGKADANKDKDITNGELLAYMDQNVAQKASELGRQQNPSLAGDPDKILMSYR